MQYSLLIEWTHITSVGIPIIDDQHRGIVSVINSLAFFIQQNKGEFFLNTAFAMMEGYTRLHFYTEEELMKAANSPDFVSHQRQHANLICESFFKANESLRLHDSNIYLNFLKDWWLFHINKQDRVYTKAVRNYINSLPRGELAGAKTLVSKGKS
jgi:hemerythrin